jgi:hypothetical protein
MPVESVWPRLEPLLPKVRKPVQYVGGELNAQLKEWDTADVRWCLMYPDAYEVGLPNQGVMILYEVLNEQPGVLAERTYSVWPDLEALMREHGIGQFTVEGHRPVSAFDAFGISFSTELGYTNFLVALELAGIPLQSRDRTGEHPIVIAGGHAAFNPEPIADFLDAVVLGDGEQPDRPHHVDPLRRPATPVQAHRLQPRRVAVSQAAAGAARRERPRADERGDLPRLHAGLPVLPSRDDHPSGARAQHHRHRRDGRGRARSDGL